MALVALLATATAAGASFDFDAVKAVARQRLLTPHATSLDRGGAQPATWPAVHMKPRFAPWTMGSRFVPLPKPPRAGCAPTRWHSIQLNGIATLTYRPHLFDWAAAGLPDTGADGSGFCGFDLLYTAASGRGHVPFARFGGDAWQLTADGLAYGAAAWLVASLDDSGRPQPVPFTEYWLVRPAVDARQLRIYALAESTALVAAAQLDLTPGSDARARVQLALYPRQQASRLLLAPIIGNFVQDEHRPGRVLPLQAECHSVDGLAIHNPAGWVWRPLHNPPTARGDSLAGPTPRGYGLLQRDRDASSYAPGSEHPRQPDVWVEPAGDWGDGQLRLFEQPATDPTADNVRVGFVPNRPLVPGAVLTYTVHWTRRPMPMPVGRVVATRSGAAEQADRRRYAVDFSDLAPPLTTAAAPQAVIDVGRGGRLISQRLVANPHIRGWRLMFDFIRHSDGPVPLRAYLQHDYQAVTETWDYVDLAQ